MVNAHGGRSGNTLVRRFVFGPAQDEPLVWYEGTGTSDRRGLDADERGSIIRVTSAAGTTMAINSYDDYGVPGSGNLGRFGFTGQVYLSEIGMNDFKARIYAPGLGRFLQPDPIGYSGGINLYNYAGANPIDFTDPFGLIGDIAVNGPRCGAGYVLVVVVNPDAAHDAFQPEQRYYCTESGGNSGGVPGIPTGGGRGHRAPRGVPQNEIVVTAKRKSTASCVGSALWNNKGVLALDALSVAASFVPGGKGLVTAGAAVVGSATGVAALGIGVAGKDVPGAAIGAAGHYVSVGAGLLDGAKGLAENLPVAGQALAIGGAAYDVYNTLSDSGCFGGGE